MPQRGGGRDRSPREIERARPINFYLAAEAEEARSEREVDRKRGGMGKGRTASELFSNRLEVLSDWLHSQH